MSVSLAPCLSCMRGHGLSDPLAGITTADIGVVVLPSLGTGLAIGSLVGLIWQSPKIGLIAGGVVAGLTAAALSLFTWVVKSTIEAGTAQTQTQVDQGHPWDNCSPGYTC